MPIKTKASPIPTNNRGLGSGVTVGTTRVIDAENVFCTNPVVASWFSTVWNGRVLNWDVKVPLQVLVESFVVP